MSGMTEKDIAALNDLLVGVEMDRHSLPDGGAKVEALGRAIARLRGDGEQAQPAPSEQVAASVAVPEGLIHRVEEAARRIESGHAPRRIPADPTDVDLVLGEVLAWLKGEPAPFWVPAAAPVAPEREG